MRKGLAILVAMLGTPVLGGADSAVAAALADARRQPKGVQLYLRYLTTEGVPEAGRGELEKALAFHVNSLSREAEIINPVRVGANLLRLNTLDYGWSRKTYEKLKDADPYFHVRIKKEIEETWTGGVDPVDGRYYAPGVYVLKGQAKKAAAAAPWLDTRSVSELISLTQSEVPILRADWFLVRTAQQAGRIGDGYYDFLGLGKAERDFQNLIGADVAKAIKVKKEIAALMAKSGVTLNNRSMTRVGTITGAYWFTQDYKSSIDKQNTLRLLDGDTEPPQGDASEQYGSLPNGLFAFWLQNAQGQRQDTAPDFIASDGRAPGTDRRVHAGISCIRCHVEGIRPIDDWARRVYRNRIKLNAVDYEKFKRLRQLYLSDLAGQVREDQDRYAKVLLRVNGLLPRANAAGYAAAWETYQEAELGIEDVARELGVKAADFLPALQRYAAATATADPILTGLLQDPPALIRREHWEELVPIAWGVIGYGRGRR